MRLGIILIVLVSAGLIFRVAAEGTAAPERRLRSTAIPDASRCAAKKSEGAYLLAQGGAKAPAAASADNTPERGAPGKPPSESTPDKVGQARKKDPRPTAPPAPIKPFNPSEKIDADQAVDFPYDI